MTDRCSDSSSKRSELGGAANVQYSEWNELNHVIVSSNRFMSFIFCDFSHLCCTFTGFKTVYGSFYENKYFNYDVL